MKRQNDDLHELLGKDEWDWVGVGRDDGNERGEYSPIFYKKSAGRDSQYFISFIVPPTDRSTSLSHTTPSG